MGCDAMDRLQPNWRWSHTHTHSMCLNRASTNYERSQNEFWTFTRATMAPTLGAGALPLPQHGRGRRSVPAGHVLSNAAWATQHRPRLHHGRLVVHADATNDRMPPAQLPLPRVGKQLQMRTGAVAKRANPLESYANRRCNGLARLWISEPLEQPPVHLGSRWGHTPSGTSGGPHPHHSARDAMLLLV